jgi:L-alanine-DL-glutamate epimerase-like enolase superfamily enzyme
MPIERVEWFCFAAQRGDGGGNQRLIAAVRLRDADAATGGAILHIRRPFPADQRSRAEEVLKGLDADSPDAAWDELYAADLGLELLSLCDIALWDLYARRRGKSVHALLGTKRTKIPAYLSTAFNVGEPEAYGELALRCRDRGYRGYKIHPYITFTDVWGEQVGYPDKDIEAYRAARVAVGDDYPIMSDNFCTYDLPEAIRVGRAVEELGFLWYESPMMETEDRIEDYLRLKDELSIPICTTETTPGCHVQRLPWLDRGACDIARIDPAYGGFTSCVRLADACRQAGIKLEIHVGDTYSLQLMAACEESFLKYYETFHLGTEEKVKPARLTPEPLADGDGMVTVPDRPGMGVEIDWRLLESRSQLEL